MKQYESYKPSETPWIGDIPSHWTLKRLRYIFRYQKGKNPSELFYDYEEGMIPYLSMDYIRENSENTQYACPTSSSIICQEGDLILLWDGSNAGEFLLSKQGILCSTCAVISVRGCNKNYLWYWCKTIEKYLKEMTNGMGVPHVDAEILKNLQFTMPPMKEQEAIVNYLEEKCGNIDRIIATQEQRIELLGELKQSIITEAVTRGLNAGAPMKDSKIDWIGFIPAHWDVLRGKFATAVLAGYAFDSGKFTSDEGYMPLIRIRDINNTTTEMNYTGVYPEAFVIRKGDTLIGMDGDFNVAQWKGEDALLNQRVCKIQETGAMLSQFAYYLLPRPLQLINDVCYATTVKHLSTFDILNSPIPVPPISEQQAIIEYLNTKCEFIDSAMAKAKREIELLRELKQTTITEAVTGKVKVF